MRGMGAGMGRDMGGSMGAGTGAAIGMMPRNDSRSDSDQDDQNSRAQKRSRIAGAVSCYSDGAIVVDDDEDDSNSAPAGGVVSSSGRPAAGSSNADGSASEHKGGGGVPYRPKLGDGPRVALCIGNDNYPGNTLPNCVADAEDMGACCEQLLGFDTVIILKDANKLAIMQAVRKLRDEHIKPGSLVLFFFSGHGVEHEGVSYLLPLGMASNSEEDLPEEAVSVDSVMRAFSNFPAAVNVLLLDCCRENELNTTFKKSKGLVDTGAKGFGKNIRSTHRNAEFLVGLACDPGTVALPNKDARNSRYTAALLRHLPAAGRHLLLSMQKVNKDVFEGTQKKQRPWVNHCLMQDVVLVPG